MIDVDSRATSVAVRSRRPVSIWPFSRPLTDLHLTILAVPAMWLLGVEQVLPLILLGWAFAKLLLTRRKLRFPPVALLFALYLLWQLFASTSIDMPGNWILFGRNFAAYAAGLFAFLIVVNGVRRRRDFYRTIGAIVICSLVVVIIGMAFVMGALPASFQAPVAAVLPGFLKQSTFVQENIILREVGRWQAEFGGLQFSRVSSAFLFPTTAAAALLIFIPVQFFLLWSSRGMKRLLLALLLVVSLICLALTATRTAIIALPVAAIVALIVNWLKTRKLPRLLLPAVTVLLLLAFLAAGILLLTQLFDLAEQLFVASRSNSFTARMAVYWATLDSLAEHPFLGWGTPRSIPDVLLAPAGTHGEYVNVLYSFGLVGLALYLSMYVLLWLRVLRTIFQARGGPGTLYGLVALVVLLALNLNGAAHGLYFDLTVVLLFWTVVGLLYSLSSIGDTIAAGAGRQVAG